MTGLRQVWTLVSHELRTRWRSLTVWAVALGALGALYIALYPSMSGFFEDYLQNAPASMRKWLGDLQGPVSVEQWLEMEFTKLLIPVALPFLAMVIGTRAVAGNEERKALDLLLSNPLPRWRVIAGALGTMALSLAGILAVTWILTYVAVPIAGVELSAAHLAAGLAAQWPVCLFFGSLALLVSTLVRRSALAVAIPGAIVVAMYLIDSLAKVSKSIEPLRVVSFFYYLGKPLEGDFPWTVTLVMLAGVCVFAGLAVAAFSRRDIYT